MLSAAFPPDLNSIDIAPAATPVVSYVLPLTPSPQNRAARQGASTVVVGDATNPMPDGVVVSSVT
jgi:hypothetical protein